MRIQPDKRVWIMKTTVNEKNISWCKHNRIHWHKLYKMYLCTKHKRQEFTNFLCKCRMGDISVKITIWKNLCPIPHRGCLWGGNWRTGLEKWQGDFKLISHTFSYKREKYLKWTQKMLAFCHSRLPMCGYELPARSVFTFFPIRHPPSTDGDKRCKGRHWLFSIRPSSHPRPSPFMPLSCPFSQQGLCSKPWQAIHNRYLI